MVPYVVWLLTHCQLHLLQISFISLWFLFSFCLWRLSWIRIFNFNCVTFIFTQPQSRIMKILAYIFFKSCDFCLSHLSLTHTVDLCLKWETILFFLTFLINCFNTIFWKVPFSSSDLQCCHTFLYVCALCLDFLFYFVSQFMDPCAKTTVLNRFTIIPAVVR